MEELPLAPNCKVLKITSDLIFLEKAPGILSHPNSWGKNTSRTQSIICSPFDPDEECYRINNSKSLYLTHRLDSPTSGIMVTSSNKNLAKEIKAKFKSREVRKTYHAVIFSKDKILAGKWRNFLIKKKLTGKLRVLEGQGKIAESLCSVVKKPGKENRLALIKLQPLTGRTHQLRIQCSLRNLPIIGDKTYGDFKINRAIIEKTKVKRLCLHATKISIQIRQEKFTLESPLPVEFEQILSFD